MESPVVTSHVHRQAPCPHPAVEPFEASRFRGRYPAQVRRVQQRVEGERALLTLALETFQAELVAAAV